MTFINIRTWLQTRSLLAVAPCVALAGIEDLNVLIHMDRTALLQLGIPNDLVNRMLRDEQPALACMPPARHDVQPYRTTRHGSLHRALAAGAPTSRANALQLLETETYAPSEPLEDLAPDCDLVGLGPSTTHRDLSQSNRHVLQGGRLPLIPELLHTSKTGTPETQRRRASSRR